MQSNQPRVTTPLGLTASNAIDKLARSLDRDPIAATFWRPSTPSNTVRFQKQLHPSEGGFEPLAQPGGDSSRSRRGQASSDQRKAQQLCAQVRETLDFVLAEHCDDPILGCLSIREVTPAPNAARLLVTLVLDRDAVHVDPKDAVDALRAMRGAFRHEIALEINRKKTPELAFEVLPAAPTL